MAAAGTVAMRAGQVSRMHSSGASAVVTREQRRSAISRIDDLKPRWTLAPCRNPYTFGFRTNCFRTNCPRRKSEPRSRRKFTSEAGSDVGARGLGLLRDSAAGGVCACGMHSRSTWGSRCRRCGSPHTAWTCRTPSTSCANTYKGVLEHVSRYGIR